MPRMAKRHSVRLGIIGCGSMGQEHARRITGGEVPGCELAAVCDVESRDFPGVRWFADSASLYRAGVVDAVLIATPHYAHVTEGIRALRAGVHVLVEKPIAVDKAGALKLLGEHRGRRQVFAVMFNQRTDPHYRKLRDLVQAGELGRIQRVNWIITDWFRPDAYYRHGGWRATWAGEGGGVLLNQCPHQLDLYQWIFGQPARVRGFCRFGRYHRIEVEDDVTAYFEHAGGATGVFVTTTGEAPGTNRLEVAGERGRVVLEDRRMEFRRNEVPVTEFSRRTKERFGLPPVWRVEIPLPASAGEQHVGILKNFTAAILRGEPLLAPAAEGLASVELANAILQSSIEDRTVDLPLAAPVYARLLARLRKGELPKLLNRRR